MQSEELAKDVDIDDIDFVALAKHLKGYLWTGDKVLYKALKEKKYNKVLDTKQLLDLRSK